MKAYLQAQVISVGTERQWTSKRGEEVRVRDCYVLVEDDPRPVQASADPALAVKPGEASMFHVDLYPSRFEGRPFSITLRSRVRASAVA